MSKLTIIPYNGEGEAVKRGVCTIPSEANIEEVVARISQAVSREGVNDIVHVEVKHDCGELIYAFDVRPSEFVQTDGEGSQDFARSRYPHHLNRKRSDMPENENNTELTAEEKKAQKEAERAAKKAEKEAQKEADKAAREAEKEAKKQAAAEAKEAAKAAKGPTKKQAVHDFITGTARTIEEIAAHVGVETTAARSLINDVKRAGVSVTTSKGEGEDKATRYLVAAASE